MGRDTKVVVLSHLSLPQRDALGPGMWNLTGERWGRQAPRTGYSNFHQNPENPDKHS
jgi:hypothetical protein